MPEKLTSLNHWCRPIYHHNEQTYYCLYLTRTKTVESARADGEKIRLIGAAEARAVEAVGR